MQKKILIVDDEPQNLDLLRKILTLEYRLFFAKDGASALDGAKRHLPDLILLDVMMPDIDGFSVCTQLKMMEETAGIPVIFVTTQSDVQDEALGFDCGGVDYILKPVSAAIVRARIRTHLQLVRVEALDRLATEMVIMLGEAGHFNDTDTGLHIWRMASYARTLAEAAGWDAEQAELLALAAPMHDTGKIGISDKVLRAPRKLTAQEWEIMKTHCQLGYDILNRSRHRLFEMAAEVALYHHERWDGTGYPHGLAGEEIPESARIVAVADVFDALTSKRSYKRPWPIHEAIAEVRNASGTHLDPTIVGYFFKKLDVIVNLKREWHAKEMEA